MRRPNNVLNMSPTVGLVTFAGSPTISCPLTTDYAFFREMLEEASPENVSQGGTRIGDALRKSVDKLLSEERAGEVRRGEPELLAPPHGGVGEAAHVKKKRAGGGERAICGGVTGARASEPRQLNIKEKNALASLLAEPCTVGSAS